MMNLVFIDDDLEDEEVADFLDKVEHHKKINLACTLDSYLDALSFFDDGKFREIDAFIVDLYFNSRADGLRIIDLIRARAPYVPIYTVSSTIDMENDRTSAELRGATRFFRKSEMAEPDFLDALTGFETIDRRSVGAVSLLHLSDLHFTSGFDWQTCLSTLVADIRSLEKSGSILSIDLVVCSGDFANSAGKDEYASVGKFLHGLMTELELEPSLFVFVPGNHDVDWTVDWYQFVSSFNAGSEDKDAGLPIEQGYLVQGDRPYSSRFDNYVEFESSFRDASAGLPRGVNGWSVTFPKHDLQFLCFNTADGLDEFRRGGEHVDVANIDITHAVNQGDREIASFKGATGKDFYRLAVMHHPPRGSEGVVNATLLERLADAKVSAVMHGHIHELERAVELRSTQGRPMQIIGAGAVGAPERHRPKNIPPMYHVIEIDRRGGRAFIQTRQQRIDGGRFSAFPIWEGEDPSTPDSTYAIDLTKVE